MGSPNGGEPWLSQSGIELTEVKQGGGFREFFADGAAQPADELHAALRGPARQQHQLREGRSFP
jgi:hypothetical protein